MASVTDLEPKPRKPVTRILSRTARSRLTNHEQNTASISLWLPVSLVDLLQRAGGKGEMLMGLLRNEDSMIYVQDCRANFGRC